MKCLKMKSSLQEGGALVVDGEGSPPGGYIKQEQDVAMTSSIKMFSPPVDSTTCSTVATFKLADDSHVIMWTVLVLTDWPLGAADGRCPVLSGFAHCFTLLVRSGTGTWNWGWGTPAVSSSGLKVQVCQLDFDWQPIRSRLITGVSRLRPKDVYKMSYAPCCTLKSAEWAGPGIFLKTQFRIDFKRFGFLWSSGMSLRNHILGNIFKHRFFGYILHCTFTADDYRW